MNSQQMQIALQQITSCLRQVTFQGRAYQYDRKPLSDAGKLLVRYRARKRQGEDFNPTVQITVALDEGLDLYDLKVEAFDGDMNQQHSSEYSGMYAEDFGNFATI